MELAEFKRLAAEVSVQHGIRLDPDNPIMAIVTLNRLVLERSLNKALRLIKQRRRNFIRPLSESRSVPRSVRKCANASRQCVASFIKTLTRRALTRAITSVN